MNQYIKNNVPNSHQNPPQYCDEIKKIVDTYQNVYWYYDGGDYALGNVDPMTSNKINYIINIFTRESVENTGHYFVGGEIFPCVWNPHYEYVINSRLTDKQTIQKYIKSFGSFDGTIILQKKAWCLFLVSIDEYNSNGEQHGVSLRYNDYFVKNINNLIKPEYNIPLEFVNDKIVFYGRYINGIQHGYSVEYNDNHKTSVVTKYDMGQIVYPQCYYNVDGELIYAITDNTEIDGIRYTTKVTYYPDESVFTIEKMIDDKRDGKLMEYDENGQIRCVAYYKNNMLHGREIKYSNDIPTQIVMWNNGTPE